MQSVFCFIKIELRFILNAAHIMLNINLNTLLEIKLCRSLIYKRHLVIRERGLQATLCEQLLCYCIGVHTLLALNNNTHTFFIAFITDMLNAFNFLFIRQLTNFIHERLSSHSIRNLVEYKIILFNIVFSANLYTTVSSAHNIGNIILVDNQTAGREIWAGKHRLSAIKISINRVCNFY